MEQETQSILEMLRDGKINADQAAQLLEALDAAGASNAQQPAARARRLRINVTDTRSGRTTVNVNIPFGLIEVASKMGLSLGIKRAPELADLNFDDIMTAIRNGAEGKIVDIEDDKDRQHVTVMVE
jgi:hypothetical protein